MFGKRKKRLIEILKKKYKLPRFHIVAGTKAHGSLDTRISAMIAEKISKKGFNSRYLGVFSFQEFPNGEIYILKHERRSAWKYKYTPSQTDAEGIIFNIHEGTYPKKTKGQTTGHSHTAEGTIISFKGIDIINVPAFVAWLPYPKARTMMHYYQSDIGCWIYIITKDGRSYWQKWLYPPFIYDEIQDKIIKGKPSRKYVDVGKLYVDTDLARRLLDAKYVAIFFGDTHTGEKEAPCPEKFKTTNNAIRKPDLTIANRLMNTYWYHMMYMIKFIFKPQDIYHLGDGVAGTNPFEKYRSPLMTNLEEEADALAELMNALNFDKKTLKELIEYNLMKFKENKK